jgi:hypothetical protein
VAGAEDFRNQLARLALVPRYFDFQLQYAACAMPNLRQIYFACMRASASLGTETICVSLNRDRFI